MNATLNLTDIETLALDKAANGAAKPARKGVEAGKYNVDFVARITGTVNVGDDYEATPTTSIPLLDVLALAVNDMGVIGPHFLAAIERSMIRVLDGGDDAKALIKATRKSLDGVEAKVRATLKALPKKPCKGPVTTKLTVIKVEEASVAA